MLNNDDLLAIRKIVKEEAQEVEQRLDSKLSKINENLEAKISKVQEVIDVVQEVVVKHHTTLEKRVEHIEEDLHIHNN